MQWGKRRIFADHVWIAEGFFYVLKLKFLGNNLLNVHYLMKFVIGSATSILSKRLATSHRIYMHTEFIYKSSLTVAFCNFNM